MKLIVDANIVFAALIKNSIVRKLILGHNNLELYTTSFVFKEIFKYHLLIKNKANLNNKEFKNTLIILFKELKVFNEKEIKVCFDAAKKICPDINDIHYFALALKLNCPIWSNDKKLKEQNKIKIVTTKELMEST